MARKDLIEMRQKYSKKLDPAVISARLTAVKDIADTRYEDRMASLIPLREMILSYLDTKGITGGTKATYLAFGMELAKFKARTTGKALEKIALGLKAKYNTAFGLEATILDGIIEIVIGYVPTAGS